MKERIREKKMPIYCYKCPNCGTEEEHLELNNQIPRLCAKCGKETERIVALSNFVIN